VTVQALNTLNTGSVVRKLCGIGALLSIATGDAGVDAFILLANPSKNSQLLRVGRVGLTMETYFKYFANDTVVAMKSRFFEVYVQRRAVLEFSRRPTLRLYKHLLVLRYPTPILETIPR